MGTKTISITEEAYDRLASKKMENESFSEVINRITNKVKLSDFFGILSKNEADLLERNIKETRKKSTKRLEKIRL